MYLLYNISIWIYLLAIHISSLFNRKAKQWINGRKDLFKKLKQINSNNNIVWFHCASLGEYEQGRPLIEAYKIKYPERKILLTFFSPSGYEIEKNKDCVLLVGQDLARSAKLLCFDEMEVRDIADAMILSRLFNVMFSYGTTLVTTSNQPPNGLYKNGLHRDRILPFIENLKLKTEIIEIQNGDDWRERSLSGNKVWLSPINKENKKKIDNIFLKLSLGFVKQSETIEISGRTIFIPQVAAGIAKIDFDDLCNKPLAASDYIEIGQRYKGIIIENIPVLDDKSRNETRRFIWLIDALYDKNCFLIANAETDFRKIYQGEEWEFEFQRTISRIVEMSQV